MFHLPCSNIPWPPLTRKHVIANVQWRKLIFVFTITYTLKIYIESFVWLGKSNTGCQNEVEFHFRNIGSYHQNEQWAKHTLFEFWKFAKIQHFWAKMAIAGKTHLCNNNYITKILSHEKILIKMPVAVGTFNTLLDKISCRKWNYSSIKKK